MGGRNTRTRVSEPIHGFAGRFKSVQRGTHTATSTGDQDASITAVVEAKAYALAAGLSSTDAGIGTSQAYLTSPTNVRTTVVDGAVGGVASWTVVEEY